MSSILGATFFLRELANPASATNISSTPRLIQNPRSKRFPLDRLAKISIGSSSNRYAISAVSEIAGYLGKCRHFLARIEKLCPDFPRKPLQVDELCPCLPNEQMPSNIQIKCIQYVSLLCNLFKQTNLHFMAVLGYQSNHQIEH
jgi:hypothetical protein